MKTNDNDNDTSNNIAENSEKGDVVVATVISEDVADTTDDYSESRRDGESVSELPVVPDVCVEADRETTGEIDNNAGRKLVGKKVETTFGVGVVSDYRSKDNMYTINIEWNGCSSCKTTLHTTNVPKICPKSLAEIANELNVAYEALEKMRRMNLDVQCHESGIPCSKVDYNTCTACLLANKGSTQSHFPRLQRLLDDANVATTDFDSQVQQQFQRLNNLFNASTASTAPVSSTTKPPNDTNLNEQFPRIHNFFNGTTTSDSKMPASANSSSKSTSSSKSQGLFAAYTAAEEEAARTESSRNGHSNRTNDKPSGNRNPTMATKPGSHNGAEKNQVVPSTAKLNHATTNTTAKQQQQKSTNRSAMKAPPSRTNTAAHSSESFPRMRKLGGWLQSLPQPVVSKASTSSHTASTSVESVGGASDNSSNSNTTSTRVAPASSSATTKAAQPSASAALAAQSFPRIRGLLDNSITTSIFGDNKVKEEGSIADPNIIMYNRISGLSTTNSPPKPAPVKSDKPIALPRIQRLINKRTEANTSPCLICASPSCAACSSPSFRREGINLCLQCERLFELDFIVDCVSTSDPTLRAERIEYMVDCYDRCLLLLHYSKQFVEQIAASLENQKEKQDMIGLASSSVGVLSGVLGIAAAASILTPAGPPLLIASLFFGGSATTVQSGTEALNYLSEPRKLADRIIALHGMSLSILRVTSTLRDAMMRDHIRTDVYEVEPIAMTNKVKESYDKNKNAIAMGSNFGRSLTLGGVAGVEASAVGAAGAVAAGEVSAVAGASASVSAASTAGAAGAKAGTSLSRAGTAAARTVRFARFAGGALSAAVLVMEANAIHSTVKSIKEGSKSDKADTLRRLIKEIDDFPSTSELDDECRAYLAVLTSRPPPPVEVAAVSDDSDLNDDEIPEAACQHVRDSDLCAPGAMILDPGNIPNALSTSTEGNPSAAAVPVTVSSSIPSLRGSSTLFQRLQSHREDRRLAAEEVVAVAVEDNQLGESNFSLVL